MNPPDYTSLPKRFWDKVEVDSDSDCWLWQAHTGRGYGKFTYQGKLQRAHRLAAIDFYGEIPEGMFALHHCDRPACVRPAHLYYGTHQDNMQDMVNRGRWTGPDHKGSQNPRAKLTETKVQAIRNMRLLNEFTKPELAIIFGVSPGTITDVVNRKTWNHV